MNGLQASTATSSSLGELYGQVRRSYLSPQWSDVVLESELSQWQIEAIRKLRQVLTLPPDWDSYGSPRASEVAITAAVQLVLGIGLDYFVTPRIVPVSGGGVQLEWNLESREVEIEINAEGSAEYLKSSDGKPIEEGSISLSDFPRIRALLTWLLA